MTDRRETSPPARSRASVMTPAEKVERIAALQKEIAELETPEPVLYPKWVHREGAPSVLVNSKAEEQTILASPVPPAPPPDVRQEPVPEPLPEPVGEGEEDDEAEADPESKAKKPPTIRKK
jgi:hypothetical protein